MVHNPSIRPSFCPKGYEWLITFYWNPLCFLQDPCLSMSGIDPHLPQQPPKFGVDIPVPRIPWPVGLDGSSDFPWHARRPSVSCGKFIFESPYDGRQVFWRFAIYREDGRLEIWLSSPADIQNPPVMPGWGSVSKETPRGQGLFRGVCLVLFTMPWKSSRPNNTWLVFYLWSPDSRSYRGAKFGLWTPPQKIKLTGAKKEITLISLL